MKRVTIIGGGISGLAAAYRLIELSKTSRQQIHVTLLEAGPKLGGIIRSETRDGFLLEHGPDSFISEKPEALALTHRLGIDSHLIETNPQHRRSFIVKNGRLRPVPQGFQLLAPSRLWPFVTSDIFSLAGKARLAVDLVLPRKNTNGNSSESGDESLAHFVRRRLGNEALERMAQPMVGGIYTADPEKLSLRATMPRFLEMEREHRSIILAMWRKARSAKLEQREIAKRRDSSLVKDLSGVSGARYGLFLSFDNGMHVLVDAVADRIAARESTQAVIRLNTRVKSIRRNAATNGHETSWRILTDRGESFTADAVCVAIPAYRAASLLQDVNENLASHLRDIKYASTATINLAYPRAVVPHPLDGFGFVVPFIEKRSLIACTFSSVKFSGRAPGGHVLLRAFVGGALQPEIFALEESEVIARVRADLRDLLGIVKEPLFAETARWQKSMPQYELGHLDRVDAIENELARIPNVALAGNAYKGAGIPDCIRSGEDAADELFTTLNSKQ